jgi:hypothetical protein
MPSENGRPRTTVDELSRRLRSQMTPLDNRFSYFLEFPVAEEDLRQYLHDPVAALPAEIAGLLPQVGIVLAPYLERGSARSSVSVVNEKPPEPRLLYSSRVESSDFATLRPCSSLSRTSRFPIIITTSMPSSRPFSRTGCRRKRRIPMRACSAKS